MGVPKLYDIAKHRLVQNIHMLHDVADLPYNFVAPILRHIENPKQLEDLERTCPQLQGETGEIWLRLIKRDVPNWDKRPHQPRDPRSWSKVYQKLVREADKERAQQEKALKEKMLAIQQNRAGNQTTILDGKTGRDPTRRRRGGTGASSSWGNPAAPVRTGKAVFDKLRRGVFDQKQARPKATKMPTHLLEQRKSTVQQAPARLVRMAENSSPNDAPKVNTNPESTASPNHRISKPGSRPNTNVPSKPVPKQGEATHAQPERPTLPKDRQFTAPRLQQAGSPKAPKRRREEPSIFHQPKKRKL